MTPQHDAEPAVWLRLLLIVAGVAIALGVGLEPDVVAEHVGVIATATLALLAANLIVGGVVVLLESHLSPELFWFWPVAKRPRTTRRSATPVTAIMVLAVVASWAFGGNTTLHGVRDLRSEGASVAAGSALPERPAMASVFSHWREATSSCGTVRPVKGGLVDSVRLRPMFLVASEGGGIRAAYWAAASMDVLSGSASVNDAAGHIAWESGTFTPCGQPLFATGASGGSVGLTVARFSGRSGARDRVLKMASADALGVATAGLLIRDLVYGLTGIPVYGHPAPTDAAASSTVDVWRDRAALMEDVWAAKAGLGVSFVPVDTTDASRSTTGALVLNSTRVADGCRAWISQVELGALPGAACDESGAPSGHTIDVLQQLWREPKGEQLCLGSFSAATAALLGARFPFVTPSGVIGPCGADVGEQQFVDGGYVENSGIKTIIDLAPQWLVEVQRHNEYQLRTATVPDLVVPVVLYLDNGAGSDLVTPPPSPTPEPLVPSRTRGRAQFALVDTPSLLGDVEAQVGATSVIPGGSEQDPVRAAVDGWRKNRVFLVHQATFPAVTAPLGWVLSGQSVDTMDRALFEQAQACRGATSADAQGTPLLERATLCDALRLIK